MIKYPLFSCNYLIHNEAKTVAIIWSRRPFQSPARSYTQSSARAVSQLADLIDWGRLNQEFGDFFVAEKGAPALSMRLIAGLHYLKHTFALSDEQVVARRVENAYWQYFCGEEYFQYDVPCHPTSLTKWRNRIGEAGCERLLSMTIQAGLESKTVKQNHLKSVAVDSTVQEKAITFPTDGKLYERC